MAQFVPLGFFTYPRYIWNALVQLKLEISAVKQIIYGFLLMLWQSRYKLS